MEFYTYVWRDATGTPFYVGKGKGRRAQDTTRRSKVFKEVYVGGGCSVEIVDWFIHESQAHAHEVELIEFYGRRFFGGPLVNMTDGGEGTSGLKHSVEARDKIAAAKIGNNSLLGKNHSAETRAKMSETALGRPKSQEHRNKIGVAFRGRILTEEHRAKLVESHLGKAHTSVARENMRVAQRMKPPSAGYKGVSLSRGKWQARIIIDGARYSLGCHAIPEDAARAYDKAAIAAWGLGNCYLNFKYEAIDGNPQLVHAAA